MSPAPKRRIPDPPKHLEAPGRAHWRALWSTFAFDAHERGPSGRRAARCGGSTGWGDVVSPRRWDDVRPALIGRLTDPAQVRAAVPAGLREYPRTRAEVAADADDPARRARWEAAVRAWRQATGLGKVHELRVTVWAAMGRLRGEPYPSPTS